MADERTFWQRFMDARKEMENPAKDKKANVGKFSYDYESLDQVIDIVDTALMKHGLCQTQRKSYNKDAGCFVLETVFFDANGERIMDTRPIPPQSDAQKDGSYETYQRRYALKSICGLCGEDDDGEATKKQKRPQPISHNQSQAITEECALFAEKKGKTVDEVWKALASSNTAKGHGVAANAKIDGLTYEQAGELLNVVRNWNEQVSAESLAPSGIEF